MGASNSAVRDAAYYDVVIIGAGLAGCALGVLLRRAGKSVLAVDKADLCTKDKLCGGVVTNKSYRLLQDIFGEAVHQLSWRQHTQSILETGGVRRQLETPVMRTIHRQELDRFALMRFLEAGGDVLDRTTYECLDLRRRAICLHGSWVSFSQVVAADGVLSQVRRQVMGRRQRAGLSFEAFKPASRDALCISCIDGLEGYRYVLPNAMNTVVGIASFGQQPDLRQRLVEQFGLSRAADVRGALLPTGDDVLLSRAGAFFIGDAAGLISPITGEGIYYALASAKALAADLSTTAYRRAMAKALATIRCESAAKRIIYHTRLRNRTFTRYGADQLFTTLVNTSVRHFLR